jgi:hypothetical protein
LEAEHRRKKQVSLDILKAMTMSEGALTKDIDLVPGKWRINASLPGHKVVGCALEGLRHRPFPLRQVEVSEFAERVPFDDKNGEPMEPPVVLRGLPTMYFHFGVALYLWPVPLHAWRLKLVYAPREETRTRNALVELTGAPTPDS